MLNFYLLRNLLKIYKNINLHLAYFGKKYYNFPCKMLPGKSGIERRHVFRIFLTDLSKIIK